MVNVHATSHTGHILKNQAVVKLILDWLLLSFVV